MIVVEKKYGKVEFLENIPCVAWVPAGYMSSDEFRESLTKGIEYYAKKKPQIQNLVWLNDARKMKVVGKDDQAWLAEFVNTQAMKQGLKYIAFVLPESIFGKMAIKLYIESTLKKGGHNIEIKTFTNIDKAKEWLVEKARTI